MLFPIRLLTFACAISVLTTSGCTTPSPSGQATSGPSGFVASSPTARADTGAVSQFTRFLSLSIATRKQILGMYDSVYTRGDIHVGGDVAPCKADDETMTLWLADYHVTSVRTHGDSADAAAVVTSAARQVQEPDGESYVATPQLSEDTVHWQLIKAPATGGKWMVCGPGGNGKEIVGVLMLGRTIKWPSGASPETVRNTIDSIRLARGLPLAH